MYRAQHLVTQPNWNRIRGEIKKSQTLFETHLGKHYFRHLGGFFFPHLSGHYFSHFGEQNYLHLSEHYFSHLRGHYFPHLGGHSFLIWMDVTFPIWVDNNFLIWVDVPFLILLYITLLICSCSTRKSVVRPNSDSRKRLRPTRPKIWARCQKNKTNLLKYFKSFIRSYHNMLIVYDSILGRFSL